MAVAIYLRVSTEEQRDQGTIETQRQFAQNYCALYSLGAPLEFADEGFSGTIPLEQRPAGQRLLRAAEAGVVTTVYIYKLDRLGRDPRVTLNAIAALEAAGGRVVSMTEPFDTTDPSGRFLVTILAGVAGLERDTIAERTSAGIRRAARAGRWVAGPAPYGFRLDLRDVGQYLEPDEQPLPGSILSPAAVVRHLYQRVGGEGWSTVQAQDELRRLHIPPRTEPGSRLNRLGQPVVSGWHAGNIGMLLKNPVYKGVLLFGKTSKRGVVESACTPLVTEHLWEATVTRLATGLCLRNWQRDGGYFLTGLLHCGVCGARMNGVTARQRGVTYRYYRCPPRRSTGRCRAGIIPMDETDARVWRRVLRTVEAPESLLAGVEDDLAAPAAASLSEKAELELSLAENRQERDRVIRLARKGSISEDRAGEELSAIQQEEDSLILQLEALTPEVALDWRGDADRMLAVVRAELLADTEPLPVRRDLLRLLVRRIVVRREKGAEWGYEWNFLPQSVNRSA